MSERVKYTVQFAVRNVHPDGWYTFKSKRYDSEKDELRVIGKTLKSYMESILNSISNIDMMVRRDNRFDLLMEEIFRRSAEKVTITLGLVVECISLDRCKTEEDDHYNKMLEEKGREFMEEEYERILTQAKTLLETRGGDALSMLRKHEDENVMGTAKQISPSDNADAKEDENESTIK
jgi:dsDNA-binding SOS-regulon protein